MNEAPIVPPSPRLLSPAALLGVGVLLASLGAAGAWLIHTPSARAGGEATPALALVAPHDTAAEAGPVPRPAPAEPAAPAPTRAGAHAAAPAHAAGPRSPAPARVRSPAPAAPVARATEPAPVCHGCGVVESVRAYQRKGEASGVGAVAGGVIGGAVGNRFGHGNGRAAMTVLGAIGGGLAGHEIEKRVHSETVYEVRVHMDDGSVRTLTRKTAPAVGARVIVEGESLRAAPAAAAGA